jgi:peroxiredoxin
MPSRLIAFILLAAASLLIGSRPLAGEDAPAHAHDGVPEKFPEHPAVGEPAPDFTLKDTDGVTLALGEYLGRGYLVLAFGSASSANFKNSAAEMDRLAHDWERMEVKVLVVYTREAHPAALRSPVPKNYPDRVALARDTRKGLKVGLRFLVDGWDDGVHKAYGAMPDGAFLLDRKGTIVARQVQAKASALDHELHRLLNVPDPPSSQPTTDTGH